MKNIYLITFTAFSVMAFAQTTITKSANDYQSGDTVNNVIFTGTPNNAETGYPKTFDNSALTAGTAIVGTVSTPSAAEITAFPGSTIKFSDGQGNDIFYKSSATNLQITGATIGTAVLNFNADNALFLNFPTNFGDSYTDTASGSAVSGTTNAYFKGTITTNSDGAGILKLGAQSFNNVIRVQTFQDYKLYLDSSFSFQLGTLKSTIYTYYDSTTRYPVFTTTTATLVVPIAGINQITNNAVGQPMTTLATQNNSEKNKIQIYPNPTTENLFFAGDLSNYETAKIFSVDGRLIGTQSINSDQLNVYKLQSGTYILQLSGSNKKAQSINFIKK